MLTLFLFVLIVQCCGPLQSASKQAGCGPLQSACVWAGCEPLQSTNVRAGCEPLQSACVWAGCGPLQSTNVRAGCGPLQSASVRADLQSITTIAGTSLKKLRYQSSSCVPSSLLYNCLFVGNMSESGHDPPPPRDRIPSQRVTDEDAFAEKLLKLKHSRTGYLAHLNKLYKQAEICMLDFTKADEVKTLRGKIEIAFDNVVSANNIYCDNVQDPIEIEAARKFIKDQVTSSAEFHSHVAAWLNHSRSPVNSEVADDRSPTHTSRRSSISRATVTSMSSSVRLKDAKLKQALAVAKLEQIEAEQTLQKKQIELQMQGEMLKAQNEVKLADIEYQIMSEAGSEAGFDSQSYHSYAPSTSVKNPELLPKANTYTSNDVAFSSTNRKFVQTVTQTADVKPTQSTHVKQQVNFSPQAPFIPVPNVVEQGHFSYSAPSAPVSSGNVAHFGYSAPSAPVSGNVACSPLNPEAPAWDQYQRSMEVQAEAYQKMASAVIQGLDRPKPEYLYFSGEPTTYWKFMTNFQVNFSSVTDLRTKLNYLIQYCRGEAREAIEDCVLLDADSGFSRACQILQTLYGKPHVIANAYIQDIVNGSTIKASDGAALSKLSLQMQKCEITLRQMGYEADLNNSENLRRTVRRLPMHVRAKWAENADRVLESGREPRFSELASFIADRARVASTVYGKDLNEHYSKSTPVKQKSGARRTFTTQSTEDSNKNQNSSGGKSNRQSHMSQGACSATPQSGSCVICEKTNHTVDKCYIFKRKSIDQRLEDIKKHGLCFNCLSKGHISRGCTQNPHCTEPGCNKKHHTLLHGYVRSNQADGNRSSSSEQVDGTGRPVPDATKTVPKKGCHATGVGACKVYLKTVPVRVIGPHKVVETYALLDNCSDVTLCTKRLAQELEIDGVAREFSLTTVNKESCGLQGAEVSFQVEGLSGEHQVDIDKAFTLDDIPVSENSVPRACDVTQWSHLQGIQLPEIAHKDIGLLIGADNPEVFWTLEERCGGKKEPYAIKTVLGWTLIGPATSSPSAQDFQVNFINTEQELLHRQVERMWTTEFGDSIADDSVGLSQEDKQAMSVMESTLCFADNHYQLSLPLRGRPPPLKNNKNMIRSRLDMLKRRLIRDQGLMEKYKIAMGDYIAKGHASEVPQDRLHGACSDLVWYIPHHPVIHPHKPHKVRIVFDCAAKFGGTSLNEQLLSGPDLTNSLVGVLIRFREAPIAIMGDIEGMFNQVRVTPADTDLLRFLWWPDGDVTKEPKEYTMNVHLFGATSSPSCANFCLRQVAKDHCTKYDEDVVHTIYRNFYVDDCLKSVHLSEEGARLIAQLTDLLSCGGFRIRGWVCNDPTVLRDVPECDKASHKADLDLDHLPIERALGIKWDVKPDELWFDTLRHENPTTRRGILSTVSSLFDPLGLIAPLTLPPKLLLQALCKTHQGWDDAVDELTVRQWNQWLASLDQISKLRVARCVVPAFIGKPVDVQLHHFADASQIGYGAVSYLRVEGQDGTVHCSILLGKSRLAPIKVISIPRLELSAAMVAVKLDSVLKRELDVPVNSTYFWTDSTSVLQYISNRSRRFKTFVANRLTVIHESSEPHQWRHVRTDQNPADHASRGIHVGESDKIKQWLEGPRFLWSHHSLWPKNPDIPGLPENDPEVKTLHQVNVVTESTSHIMYRLIARSSTWSQLQKSVAWFSRFCLYCSWKYSSKQVKLLHGDLQLKELQDSTQEILRYVQREAFAEDITALQTGKHVSSSSKIKRLSPILVDGLLRVGGRLERAPVEYEARHALILPKDGHVTDLIIRSSHCLEGHGGINHTLANLRQKFWLVHGRVSVRRVLNKCMTCRRRNALVGEQIMAPLPKERLIPDLVPFTNTGVDYFGPLFTKVGRSSAKRYGCLFTCMASRAVHIELAYSLDTDSFICALQRFMSRRGRPQQIRSDNGTNFRGADKELREVLGAWNQKKISDFLHQYDIEWVFNPPAASHMGRVWERLIRCVRHTLRAVLKEQIVTDEALMTVLAEVEKILNDRPLTPLSEDSSDLCPLTPNQILLLKGNPCLPLGLLTKSDSYPVRRWRQAQYLASVFWRRWVREYLPLLQIRQKWTRTRRNFARGDLVLVVTDNAPRGEWPLGRIIETYPDKHGIVRSVRVRTSSTSLTRPITRLCLLEADPDDNVRSDSQDNVMLQSDIDSANVDEKMLDKVDPIPDNTTASSDAERVTRVSRRKPDYFRDYMLY